MTSDGRGPDQFLVPGDGGRARTPDCRGWRARNVRAVEDVYCGQTPGLRRSRLA